MGKTTQMKYLVAVLAAVAATTFVFTGPFALTAQIASDESGLATGISYGSMVCKEVIRANGQREFLGCDPNLFTNIGKNITRDLLGGAYGLAPVFVIGLGNITTQAATDAELPGVFGLGDCGLGKANGTFARKDGDPGNWTITKVFTNNCSNKIVNATGLFNYTTGNVTVNGNNVFAEDTFTSVTLQANDQINITWNVYVS